ncbi:MAG: FmdB family zinc ribbon protein [Thermodesulfovibrionales bacterium]
MKTDELNSQKVSPCSLKKEIPILKVLACAGCGEEVEIWSDEEETQCSKCGHKTRR